MSAFGIFARKLDFLHHDLVHGTKKLGKHDHDKDCDKDYDKGHDKDCD